VIEDDSVCVTDTAGVMSVCVCMCGYVYTYVCIYI